MCGAIQDSATGLMDDVATPQPGDFSLCFDCGAILVFGEGTRIVASVVDSLKLSVEDNKTLDWMQAKIKERGRTARCMW